MDNYQEYLTEQLKSYYESWQNGFRHNKDYKEAAYFTCKDCLDTYNKMKLSGAIKWHI